MKMESKQNPSGNVKVVVRVRPPNKQEREGGSKNVVKVIDDYMLVFDPKTDSEAVRFGRAPPKAKSRGTILDRRVKDLRFAFDRVFNDQATNNEVFENTTYSVIDSVLEGFNCSVFAYGATSAGKTHTMLGSSDQPGVIFLTMMQLYKKISEREEEFSCDVSVSYLEIYNETARDLLSPKSIPLAVREDPQKGVCVTGLSLHKPKNAEEILGMLEFGNQNRTQHPTDANKQSSRSHAVFQVFVRQQPKGTGLSTDVKIAKMSLIDLAGSERATVTTNRGARFREGANINRSLLALGNCINALAENKTAKGKKEIHIPYRDSKLTRLLKDSLGGNCKTIMIAAVSPSNMSYEDTYNTLKYANRAKNIKSTLKSNVISVDFHVTKYAKIVEELQQQVEDLKSKIKRYESGEATPMKQQKLWFTQKEQLKVIQDEFCGIYKDRCLIRKQIIDCEAAEKELRIKLFKRERNIERMQLIQGPDDNNDVIEQSVQKLNRFRSATKLKQTQLTTKLQSLVKQLANNDEKITSTKSRADELVATVADHSLKESFACFYETRVLEVEKVSARAQTRHLRRYILMQEKDSQSSERLVSTLLNLVHKQHKILHKTGEITTEIKEDFESLIKDLEGCRRITWADESNGESLDVASILNFTSCTPIQTPARRKCVLQSDTPKGTNDGFGPGKAVRNLDSIAAINSVFNSRSSMDVVKQMTECQGDLTSNVDIGDLNMSANVEINDLIEGLMDEPLQQNNLSEVSRDNAKMTSNIQAVTGEGIHQTLKTEPSLPESPMKNPDVIKETNQTLVSTVARQGTSGLLPRRRANTEDCYISHESKVSRLDGDLLPDTSAMDEKREFHIMENSSINSENSVKSKIIGPALPSSLTMMDAVDKERRGTMLIDKAEDELGMLPVICTSSVPGDTGETAATKAAIKNHEPKTSAVNVNSNNVLNETITLFPCTEASTASKPCGPYTGLQEDDDSSQSKPHSNNILDKLFNIPSVDRIVAQECNPPGVPRSWDTMNTTFDVHDENVNHNGQTADMLDPASSKGSKNSNLDISGIEPLNESPDRQPLAPICGNTLKGNMMTSKTASLHFHGLPSMHDRSNIKSKQHSVDPDKRETDMKKQDAKDQKSPYGVSKLGKTRYASVTPRLYDENPRYARATIANRMKTKSEKRRRSNTSNNPIRLRESRRRSRTSSAAAPYNMLSMSKHASSHMLGVRRTVEKMNLLRGTNPARNFAPSSTSGVVNNMPSSVI